MGGEMKKGQGHAMEKQLGKKSSIIQKLFGMKVIVG